MSDWFDHLPNHPANDNSTGFETESANDICIVCGCTCFEYGDSFCSDECEELEKEIQGSRKLNRVGKLKNKTK